MVAADLMVPLALVGRTLVMVRVAILMVATQLAMVALVAVEV